MINLLIDLELSEEEHNIKTANRINFKVGKLVYPIYLCPIEHKQNVQTPQEKWKYLLLN